MSKKWTVKFSDDELEGEQYAHFSSQPEALTWIKFVQSQERYDPTGFEVLDGPYEELSEASMQVDENEVLTEGKHWPEDYIKTAYNLIKQSKLGQQSWYTDSFIKQDVQTFADEFTPLSHKSSNLGLFMAVVRWFIEYSGDSKQKYQEFIERKLDSIIAALLKIRADKDYDAKADEIKKMNFSQFEKLIDEVKSKTDAISIDVSQADAKYEVVPIYSYEDLHKMYGGDKTGYKGQSEWCHTNGKSTYDSWTKNGTQMFFVIQRKDWKDIKAPDALPSSCYDAYGMSLIAILVDIKDNKLLNSTSRWNHVVLPKSGAADTMFESWQQLDKAISLNVESICKKQLAEMSKKLQNETAKANQRVAKLLKNVSVINDKTISKRLRSLVTEVSIPDNVTTIENFAFYNCNNLAHIVIPDSVTSIGIQAFNNCSKLTHVAIPDGVTSIRLGTFWNCTNLTSIAIPDSVTSIDGSAFNDCSNLMNVTIPDSVKSIGGSAFSGCTSLANVTIPDSVTRIEPGTFYECNSLTNLKIPDSVTNIENYAFSDCKSLTHLTIPDSVTSIGSSAFFDCTSLTSVSIPNGITSIKNNTFADCRSLANVTIPDSVTSIGRSAFFNCYSLAHVTIPDSVIYIDSLVFCGCKGLISVTIGNGVTSIGHKAFDVCSNLKSLVFKGKTFEEVQSMKDFPWRIPQSAVLKCKDGEFKLEDQLKVDMGVMLESCMVAAGRSPSKCMCKSYDSLCAGAFAYDVVKKCLRDGMHLQDVCIGDDGHNYVASVIGTCDTSKNRRAWAGCMQEVEQLVSHMVESGCGAVWLVDFTNDNNENVWEMHLGFDLLESPFNDDK